MIRVLLFVLLWASTAWAAGGSSVVMERTIETEKDITPGVRMFSEMFVPDDATVCTLSLDRRALANPNTKVRIWLDFHNGRAWDGVEDIVSAKHHWLQATSEGDARLSAPTAIRRKLWPGNGRKIRGGYEIQGTNLRTAIQLTCE